jgi:hypothetical protein
VYSEGGSRRNLPIQPGYKPLFNFHWLASKISGRIETIDKGVINVGETVIVEISFIKHLINERYFVPKETFTFDEGGAVIGSGEILAKIVD